MKLELLKLVGRNCITLQQGQKIYEQVRPLLASGTSVELDCTGVAVFASPFFNAAVGQLLSELKASDLHKLLHVEGLSDHGRGLLRLVVENSKTYYADPEARRVINEMLEEHSNG